jgi:hypothetical protein
MIRQMKHPKTAASTGPKEFFASSSPKSPSEADLSDVEASTSQKGAVVFGELSGSGNFSDLNGSTFPHPNLADPLERILKSPHQRQQPNMPQKSHGILRRRRSFGPLLFISALFLLANAQLMRIADAYSNHGLAYKSFLEFFLKEWKKI